MQVTTEEIKIIARLVHDLCGVVLDDTKGYLIESRLSAIAAESQCKTFSELYYKARYDNNKELQNKIIDAITTQETLFFRDSSPFEALQYKAIPETIDNKKGTMHAKRLRIWSAACSTGQEPSSIAITLNELIPDIAAWDINIMATDISDAALRQASLGLYAQHEIQRGMKPQILAKYFIQNGNKWKVKDELRSMIAFRRLNLFEPFNGLGPFDIIFCRNVAIYFTPEARRDIFQRLAKALTKNGYLFTGSSETLTDCGPQFVPQHHCRAIFYQPNLPAPASARA